MIRDNHPNAPRFTIWIRSTIPNGTSWRPYRGRNTVAAISTRLALLDALGAPSSLELESASSGPVPITLSELVHIGLVIEEHAIKVARVHFERVTRTTRHAIEAPRWIVDAGETALRLFALVAARIARITHPGGSDEN